MAALSSGRNTPQQDDAQGSLGVEAATSIFLGSIVLIDANGYAVPGQVIGGSSPLNSLRMAGIARRVHNGFPGDNAINLSSATIPGSTAAAGAAGAVVIELYRRGVFGMDYDSSISAANIGELAFANDDHIVSVLDGSGGTTVANTTSIALPSAAPLVNVLHPYIVPGSFNAYSATGAGGTHYVENTDFSVNYQSGLFEALPGGALSASGTVYVTYKYGLPTKVPVGTIVNVDGTYCWVDIARLTNPSPALAALLGN